MLESHSIEEQRTGPARRIVEGQRWRSIGDGHVVEIVARLADGTWLVHVDDDSRVSIVVDEADLLDLSMYIRIERSSR